MERKTRTFLLIYRYIPKNKNRIFEDTHFRSSKQFDGRKSIDNLIKDAFEFTREYDYDFCTSDSKVAAFQIRKIWYNSYSKDDKNEDPYWTNFDINDPEIATRDLTVKINYDIYSGTHKIVDINLPIEEDYDE
jgi:hypothetical protein